MWFVVKLRADHAVLTLLVESLSWGFILLCRLPVRDTELLDRSWHRKKLTKL